MESGEEIVGKMFRECTTGERINLSMFVTLMTRPLRVRELESKLLDVFEALDTRKSGNIDATEFHSILASGGAPFSEEEVMPPNLFPTSIPNWPSH